MEITKQFKFELAHRLTTSYSKKCQSIHGHSYLVEITLESNYLNKDGMVMDFGELKSKINYLMDFWDHSFMFYSEDKLANLYRSMLDVLPLRMIEVDYNPTAENMALHLFRECTKSDLPVKKVMVQETKTGWAYADRLKPFVGETIKYYNMDQK